jgi:hypothetical protein
LRSVKENPADGFTNVVLELADTGLKVEVGKDKPYERIDGYMVDLKYPPENKTFPSGRRVGAMLSFNGEDYKIVDIKENELVLSAPNSKKWSVKISASPTPAPAATTP